MESINRRVFIKRGVATVAVTSACLCTITGCASITGIGDTPAVDPGSLSWKNQTFTIDLSKEPILSRIGGAVKIKHESIPDGLILAHVQTNQFMIASLACTHRGVEVEYDTMTKNFKCASLGGSTYSLTGSRLSGPAQRPLKNYNAFIKGRFLIIKI